MDWITLVSLPEGLCSFRSLSILNMHLGPAVSWVLAFEIVDESEHVQ